MNQYISCLKSNTNFYSTFVSMNSKFMELVTDAIVGKSYVFVERVLLYVCVNNCLRSKYMICT